MLKTFSVQLWVAKRSCERAKGFDQGIVEWSISLTRRALELLVSSVPSVKLIWAKRRTKFLASFAGDLNEIPGALVSKTDQSLGGTADNTRAQLAWSIARFPIQNLVSRTMIRTHFVRGSGSSADQEVKLSLTLFMFWILADNHNLALTSNKSAIFTNFSNWTSNFHILSCVL